jgi:hypothetical protein
VKKKKTVNNYAMFFECFFVPEPFSLGAVVSLFTHLIAIRNYQSRDIDGIRRLFVASYTRGPFQSSKKKTKPSLDKGIARLPTRESKTYCQNYPAMFCPWLRPWVLDVFVRFKLVRFNQQPYFSLTHTISLCHSTRGKEKR